MLKVGLTGGIGSGKSEVARQLAAHGAVVIDADALAREVVEPGTPGLAAVVAEFGAGVLRSDGSLDRGYLASVVFADPAARARLEAIVHPAVRARAAELEARAADASVLVHDIPLLVESAMASTFDVVVVVECAAEVRLRRLVQRRGMTVDEARARIDSQATDAERRAVADVVIDNSGSMAALRRAVDEVWRDLVARAGAGPDQHHDDAL